MAEQAVTIWTPLLYVSILVIALVVFSNVHRKRKLQQLAETPQFYKYNFARDIYDQLKNKEKVPPKLLKAAVLTWGAEDFTRMLRYRENEPTMASLLQNGLIGETAFERFSGSKTLNEREMQEIAAEALKLNPQWTSSIQSIAEIAQQHAVRRRISQLDVFKKEYYELAGTAPPKSDTLQKV